MKPATLSQLLASSTSLHGERTALVGPSGPSITFDQLARRAEAVSLALGPSRGEVIGLKSPNCPEWAVAFFGILGSGAAVLPLDPHLTPEELANAREQFGCKRILGLDLPLEPAAAGKEGGSLPAASAADLAVLIASSGTTGKPKGVMLSHANLLANLGQFRALFPLGPEDAFLGLLPLHHAFPLMGCLLASVSCGGRLVFPEGLRPPVLLQTISNGGVSHALFVPGLLRLILKTVEKAGGPGALGPAFRTAVVGGAPCPPALLQAAETLGVKVLQGYGMSEASPVITLNTFEANRPGSVGRAVPGLEMRIEGTGEGELLVRGPNVMMGYWQDEARTAEALQDGWLRTGDIAVRDPDGYLWIRGRSKNVIISESGKNVYPEEIEAELAKSELFRESCVLGMQTDGSERIVAVVVPLQPMTPEQARAEVTARCATLAEFKRVQDVVVWEKELPKTASGKVKITAVREALR